MLNIRFQGTNIIAKLASDCGNGIDLYASASGLQVGQTYKIELSQISEDGTSVFYDNNTTFLANQNSLDNFLIKGVLLSSRYFVIKIKIIDQKNTTVFSEDITTIDCLHQSINPTSTPQTSPSPTPDPTPTPTVSHSPTVTPTISPSPAGFAACIGTDKASYVLDCCGGSVYSKHHKITIGIVNLIVNNSYSLVISSNNNYIKTFVADSQFFAYYPNKLVDVYLSLNKNKTHCADNVVKVELYDSSNNLINSREVPITCLIDTDSSHSMPDVCDNSTGIYFEDRNEYVCLHFDDSCFRFAGKATVSILATPTPTASFTPTVTPTYTRTPTISKTSDISLQSLAFSGQSTENSVNLKTQIDIETIKNVNASEHYPNSRIYDIETINNELIIAGSANCTDILADTSYNSGLITKTTINNLQNTIDANLLFGKYGSVLINTTDEFKSNVKLNKTKSVQTQQGTKIVSVGSFGNRALVCVHNQNGEFDNRFAGGHVILEQKNNVMPYEAFDVSIQPDNKIVLYCNAIDETSSLKGYCVVRLNLDGSIDSLSDHTYVFVRPDKTEFANSDMLSYSVMEYNNSIYVLSESFAINSNDNVIISKLSADSYTIDISFGEHGFMYSGAVRDRLKSIAIFNESISISVADPDKVTRIVETENGSYNDYDFTDWHIDVLNIVCVDASGHSIFIIKSDHHGNIFNTSLIDQPNLIGVSRVSIMYGTVHSQYMIKIPYNVFEHMFNSYHINNDIFDNYSVIFHHLKTDAVRLGQEVIIPVNVRVVNNINSLIDQNDGLLNAYIIHNGVEYRDCENNSCDRLPEDLYGTLVTSRSEYRSLSQDSRILFGYIKLTNGASNFIGVKLDRFDALKENNIVTSASNHNNKLVVAGFVTERGIASGMVKVIDVDNITGPNNGPYIGDIVYDVKLTDICSL